jgi:hypothetical protein
MTFLKCGMIHMKSYFTGFAIAVLLVTGSIWPGYAQDAATPAAPAATSSDAPPASVPRPSLAPKAAAPAPAATTADPDTKNVSDERPRRRRYSRRYRHGYYRTAFWQPFPIYWPHLYHSRIHWNRIPWAFRF